MLPLLLLLLSVFPGYGQNNLTYVFSHISMATLQTYLQNNGSFLSNASAVIRLPSGDADLLSSIETFRSATNVQSVVFSWNTGDCTIPSALANNYSSVDVIFPMCSTTMINAIPSPRVSYLTVTMDGLASAATLFMNSFSLKYFSLLISDSNQFYFQLAQEFSACLTRNSFILEQFLSISNFSGTVSSTLRSKVYFIICSNTDEWNLYQTIVSYSQSLSATDTRLFIFLRWSNHFISLYTKQFQFNTTTWPVSTLFSILHLLPLDVNLTSTFTDLVQTYENQILIDASNLSFSDDLIFLLQEYEAVSYLHDGLPLPLLNQRRAFDYHLVARQCNFTWTSYRILSTSTNSIITSNSNLCAPINFPTLDTTVSEDDGWRILRIVLFTLLGLGVTCAAALVAFFVLRSQRARKQMAKGPNKILLLPDDLVFVLPKGSIFTSKVDLRNEPHERSNVSLRSEEVLAGKTARYNGDLVEVKKLHIGPLSLRTKVMRELRQLKDLRHENLNTFIGIFIEPNEPALVFEYGQRGSLEDILKKEEIKLDWNFKWSMLNDLVRGMRYITNSAIRCHGNLKSRNCIVDSRWVLKITDYHLNETYALQNAPRQVDIGDLLWMAPEHVRTTIIKNDVATIMTSSAAGDVYSFGIIMQEVILRGPPFCMLDLSPQEIIAKIKKPPPLLRPSVSKQVAPPEYINSMKQCWAEQAETRPSFNDLAQSIKLLNGGKKVNIVDTMFKMLEQYSNNLEDLIKERTTQLEEEKKKTDKLLSQMLPPSVADSLKSGKAVEAVWFECVTIYFSDIVGFTTISALSSPMEVVDLLNDLYTMFDSILEDFDCYKVETIGDAYMVVSGLPIQNGINHASEIATMALTLLHACGKFKIRHMPGVPLRLRIGLHSGACVAGVVGLKMPRYCLFGDTVNTASRMESTSMAFRIHCSETTAGLLEEIGGFRLDYRGVTEIKGRGNYKTYWLCGKNGFDKDLPDPVISDNNHGLDKELVRLVEKKAREQEALDAQKAATQVQVKPIVETAYSPSTATTITTTTTTTMANNVAIDDLLRITPPPAAAMPRTPSDASSKRPSNSTVTFASNDELPRRKSNKVKW